MGKHVWTEMSMEKWNTKTMQCKDYKMGQSIQEWTK